MDGETTAQETGQAISALLRDQDLRAKWEMDHLIRDTLQNHMSENYDADFSKRVAADIEKEPAIFAPGNIKQKWIQPVIGMAMAASVAALALLTVYVNQPDQGAAPVTMAQQQIIKPQQAITVADEKKIELNELDAYLANHTEFSTGNRVQGFVPYVRVVGYGENEK